MTDEYNIALYSRQQQHARLKRIEKAAHDAYNDVSKQEDFKVCFMSLEPTYQSYQEHCDKILAIIVRDSASETVRKTDLAKEKDKLAAIDEIYWEIKKFYNKLFGNKNVSQSAQSNARLPKISLITFSGKFEDWNTYIDLFDSLVHRNQNVSEIEKFHYLVSSLGPEPLGVIKNVPLAGSSYPIAYNQLRSRFDNKRLLASSFYQNICSLPDSLPENSGALMSLVNSLAENLAQLKALGLPVNEWSFILFDLTFKKLPKNLCTKFEEQFKSSGFPTFDELKDFIVEHAKSLETVEALSTSKSQYSKIEKGSKSQQAYKPFKVTSYVSDAAAKIVCPQCKQGHTLTKCPSFISLQPNKRYEVARQHRLCLNCLAEFHSVKGCNSPHSCRYCRKRHHSMLCFDSGSKVGQSQNVAFHTQSCFGNTRMSVDLNSEIMNSGKNSFPSTSQNSFARTSSNSFASTVPNSIDSSVPNSIDSSVPNSIDSSVQNSIDSSLPNTIDSSMQNSVDSFMPNRNMQSLSNSQPGREVSQRSNSKNAVAFSSLYQSSSILLATTLLHVADAQGNFHVVRAMIDSGSSSTLLSQKCLNRLGLSRSNFAGTVTGINPESPVVSKGLAQCVIKPVGAPSPIFSVNAVVLSSLSLKLPSCFIETSRMSHIKSLPLADPNFNIPGNIHIIIGMDLFPHIMLAGRSYGTEGDPIAMETVFGYVLMGHVNVTPTRVTSLVASFEPFDLRAFWELEQVPSALTQTPEERLCEEKFQKSFYRNDEGRYVVELPFRDPVVENLGDSSKVALRRFYSLERRLAADKQLKAAYVEVMEDYIKSGQVQLVPPDDNSLNRYHISHHSVKKSDSSSLRIVFDSSARCLDTGLSLNSVLLPGPKLQKNIFDILLAFRIHTYVMNCDIARMYHQILIAPAHRTYQRIFWRSSPEDPLQEYWIVVVSFGNTASPFLALRTIKQLLLDEGDAFPLARKAIEESTYVDDVFAGADTLSEAKLLQQELMSLFEKGKFELRKWTSNTTELLHDISNENKKPISFDSEDEVVKLLGLVWSPSIDCFSFGVSLSESRTTKRSILSDIARIWDPVGFLVPVSFFAKFLIQHLWVLGVGWDDPLPEEVVSRWISFKGELPKLESLKIPRFLNLVSKKIVELHAFCDASEKGYASCIYFRSLCSNGEIQVSLVCAKSKVATLKKISLARLELCAAFLCSDLVRSVMDIFKDKVSISRVYAWSDSMIALSWIKAPPYRWKTFIANRVSHIQDAIPPDCWNFVKSEENAADPGSRGLTPTELVCCSIWWHGPQFLHTSEVIEPSLFVPIDSPEEAKVVSLVVVENTVFLDMLISRYSCWSKLLRVISYIQLFCNNARNPGQRRSILTTSDLQKSLYTLVKFVQSKSFSEDIALLNKGKACSKILRKLNPFVDGQGILRVGGRLVNSSLPFETKHPALLPRSHRLTTLLVENFHKKHLHPGVQTLQYLVSQQFWILSAKRVIKSVVSKCHRCFRVNPRTLQPPMGNLPAFRIAQLKSFQSVGVDFTGSFKLTMGRVRNAKTYKAYICVFVCASTKAIHLELCSELTTDSFLAALRRFIARRGRCTRIFSDCGTNFVGAASKLQELVKKASEAEAINWSFNPPSASHFGGLFEAGVKSVKTHLARVIGEQRLTYEEFITFLTQVEALLNSRPLCPLSNDPNDLSVLTPGHFLTLNPLSAPAEENLLDVHLNRLNRWQLLQHMQQAFWKRYHTEYLVTLQGRSKWTDSQAPIAIGTMVLIKNELQPPLRWLLGRVTELFPGKDGVCRVVNVHTSHGTFKRPLVKLCPLPLN